MIDKEIVVIGGGPGGYVAAIRAAQLGANVTIIEENKVGGTCLNIGCIPTKALLHSAELYSQIKEEGAAMGIVAKEVFLDFPQVIAYSKKVSTRLVEGVEGLLRMNKVTTLYGRATFIGKKIVKVIMNDGSEQIFKPQNIIISTGSYNFTPPIKGLKDNPRSIDSTTALSLKKLPESMVIIGGGVIGLEFACAYASFGTQVTIVEMMPNVIEMMDSELTKIGIENMQKMGVKFEMETRVESVDNDSEGVLVKCKTKDGELVTFKGEKVLVAVGRRPNTDSLNLKIAGIENERGSIVVDETMETSVSGVYAIGDCVYGSVQLAHAASVMGEIAAENALGHSVIYDPKTNPSCVYIVPEFAGVGFTEQEVKEKGIDYTVGKFPMAGNAKAFIMNGGKGMVKIIAGKEFGEILGAHIIGPRATDLIAEFALAIGSEATIDEIIGTIHSHPTLSEASREAVMNIHKLAIHAANK